MKQVSTSEVSKSFAKDRLSEIVDSNVVFDVVADDSESVDEMQRSVDSFELSAPDRSHVTFRRATPTPHSAPCRQKYNVDIFNAFLNVIAHIKCRYESLNELKYVFTQTRY